jgi:pimeloyl-ACP methyl ester carboxylesterase
MTFFTRDNARIYFEDTGSGDPIIAVHGLIENTFYWNKTGVTNALTKTKRFIAMEMRGHGRTVVTGDPLGFDADTVGQDIIALADHLKIDRFHVLTHSTGGFAAVRYAMKDCSRFATLILSDSSSSTSPVSADPETLKQLNDAFAKSFEKFTWDQIIKSFKKRPGPFFRGLVESEKCDELLVLAREIVECNDRNVIASFVRSFYTDPDPRIDDLRKIHCPVLVIYGEKDDLFIQSSKLMAKEIPGAKIVEYPGVGHMTAIEAPERLAADILEFVNQHPLN